MGKGAPFSPPSCWAAWGEEEATEGGLFPCAVAIRFTMKHFNTTLSRRLFFILKLNKSSFILLLFEFGVFGGFCSWHLKEVRDTAFLDSIREGTSAHYFSTTTLSNYIFCS